MYVSVTQLRQNLKFYLDLVENGEQITVISKSIVLARLVPADVVQVVPEKASTQFGLSDGREVVFRQMGLYEDPGPVHNLKRVQLEYAQDQPAAYFQNLGGEFWIGEIEEMVVAYGGFLCPLDGSTRPGEVRLLHLYASAELAGQGVERQLEAILEGRAKRLGYEVRK